jgi:hypothetical protein
MRMRLFFLGTSIDGNGGDQSGPFTMRGTFDDGGRVRIRKMYPGHTVHYQGAWDGAMIHGTWKIIEPGFFDSGTFEMWPELEEEMESANVAEETLAGSR